MNQRNGFEEGEDPRSTLSGPRGPRPVAKVGPFVATLLNGVFGDPLVHVRIPFHKRSLLIDLGDGARIPARIAHQVTDVFLSHAHADHIGGFMPFLRSRIGVWPLCRIFGPPGIVGNVEGFVRGIHWDRAGPRAPRFEVTELHAERVERYLVVAGAAAIERQGPSPAPAGCIYRDDLMEVTATLLDHLTPVLAYSLTSHATVNVRKERLERSGLAPGPWLTELKDKVAAGATSARIEIPDGSEADVARLADDLLLVTAGEKLVYATDLADTPANRAALTELAAGAHTMFCEATFCDSESEKAARSGHLTARACGEIASAAGVGRLIPFHFSRRYEADPARVYDEVAAACANTIVPDLDRAMRP